MSPLVGLLIAWLPLWVVLYACSRTVRPGRLLLGAAFVGFVGAICFVEFRRYGLLEEAAGGIALPLLGLRLADLVRFALLGLSATWTAGVVLERWSLPDEE